MVTKAIKKGLEGLRQWVFASPTRIQRVAAGQGEPGTRAAPARAGDNDKKIGLRLDNGETVVIDGRTYKRYKLQANKGADDPTLKSMANKDSHEVWSYADLPIDGELPKPEKLVEGLFNDLVKNSK